MEKVNNFKFPKDKDGNFVPLDTEVMYSSKGQLLHVCYFTYLPEEKRWTVSGYLDQSLQFLVDNTDMFSITPPDSWEKLEEDAKKRACDYADAPCDEDGFVTCDGCRFYKPETDLSCIQNMSLELVKRAKRLAGIEEKEDEHDTLH